MLIRQLNENQFERFQEMLLYVAQQNPLDADFNVKMVINNRDYILKIQPTTKCGIAILQALEVRKHDDKKFAHALITDSKILLALLELLLYQCAV